MPAHSSPQARFSQRYCITVSLPLAEFELEFELLTLLKSEYFLGKEQAMQSFSFWTAKAALKSETFYWRAEAKATNRLFLECQSGKLPMLQIRLEQFQQLLKFDILHI